MGSRRSTRMFARCPMPAGSAPMTQHQPADPRTFTQSPIVTGTSVLGMKFEGGVLMVSDMLGSYGSMARFKSVERIKQFGGHTVVGAGGDLSDFQHIEELLEELMCDSPLPARANADGACIAVRRTRCT